ncbi:hypothetical protein [Sulfitobacter pacificus]|uniref:Flagellar hook-length control protein-like C-terminal domain-containing protein n=1 Tax=Sulfitobacter pacificus TaxID=1499314 RepID=A0ABQ5VM51_9RHOB|nr:hypothetical protein [Sulfitobacter pacificus]GLQ28114.1 hypothetical protein GCM10007927_29170 [Sulfitobacter pacificus]
MAVPETAGTITPETSGEGQKVFLEGLETTLLSDDSETSADAVATTLNASAVAAAEMVEGDADLAAEMLPLTVVAPDAAAPPPQGGTAMATSGVPTSNKNAQPSQLHHTNIIGEETSTAPAAQAAPSDDGVAIDVLVPRQPQGQPVTAALETAPVSGNAGSPKPAEVPQAQAPFAANRAAPAPASPTPHDAVLAPATPKQQMPQAAAVDTPATASIQGTPLQQPQPTSSNATNGILLKSDNSIVPIPTASPTQDLAQPGPTAPRLHGQTSSAMPELTTLSGQTAHLTAVPQSVLPKPVNTLKDAPLTAATLSNGDTMERPVVATEAGSKPTFLIGQDKQVNTTPTPIANSLLGQPSAEPEQITPSSTQATTGVTPQGATEAAATETSVKVPVKPFTEAVMAQIKSVEATQGRTTVNLIPRGLGNIEIEVLSDKDGAARVVVRVENPVVLQALRDDRQVLAQAIGVSDSGIFDFQEHSAGEQPDPQRENSPQGSASISDASEMQPEVGHLDVVQDGHLDIMT